MLIIITSQGLGADNRCSIMLIEEVGGGGMEVQSTIGDWPPASGWAASICCILSWDQTWASRCVHWLTRSSAPAWLVRTHVGPGGRIGSVLCWRQCWRRSLCRSLLVLDKCAFIDHHSSLRPSKANKQSHCTRRRACVSDWCKASCVMCGRWAGLPTYSSFCCDGQRMQSDSSSGSSVGCAHALLRSTLKHLIAIKRNITVSFTELCSSQSCVLHAFVQL